MEDMELDRKFWCGRKVLITGNTGFKGSWLTLYLLRLGANVVGYSLRGINFDSIYYRTNIKASLYDSISGDIKDLQSLKDVVTTCKPSVIFHLAAQSLVKESFVEPLDTLSVNIIGTANILEVLRQINQPVILIVATSDKCYANTSDNQVYKESARLGGNDLYSASKACCELVVNAYNCSFFENTQCKVATVRAGNVIGGGDYAANRIIPDCVRSLQSKSILSVRNPQAIRPWQHVLEPLTGYLQLAEYLSKGKCKNEFQWNFGPSTKQTKTVEWVLIYLKNKWKNLKWQYKGSDLIESDYLMIDSSKANSQLGWRQKLKIEDALDYVTEWYEDVWNGKTMEETCLKQIDLYLELVKQ